MTPEQLAQLVGAAAGLLNVLDRHNVSIGKLADAVRAAAEGGKPFSAQDFIDDAQSVIDRIPGAPVKE